MVLTTGSAFYIVPQYRFLGDAHLGEVKVAFSLDLDLCLSLFLSLSFSLSLSFWRSSSKKKIMKLYSPIPTRTDVSDFISVRLSQLLPNSSSILHRYQRRRNNSAEEKDSMRRESMYHITLHYFIFF